MADGDISLFSDHIKLDSTLPLTLAEAAANKHMLVMGSVRVNRDLSLDASILDPDGEAEYRHEMRWGTFVEMRSCQSPLHRGLRRIPKVEFDGEEAVCRHCEGEAQRQARLRVPSPQPHKFWKRLHPRGA